MSSLDKLINELGGLETEQPNPRTWDIDQRSALEIARLINAEDATVAGAVEKALPQIAQAAELFAATIKNGGRIFYIGAGTSGRLGVLDAAECPPTFGTSPDQIIGVIAGGYDSLILSKEGAEDSADNARADLAAHGLSSKDMVIGIAASRRTPYTLAGVEYGRTLGCATAMVICNVAEGLSINPDVVIAIPVGPEAITGSTRMKSGTAQKLTLNLLSTTAMVLLGKTYGNLMVDLRATSQKLAARSRKILMDMLKLSLEEADRLLGEAGGSVKTAIVMHKFACPKAEAETKLAAAGGFISRIPS